LTITQARDPPDGHEEDEATPLTEEADGATKELASKLLGIAGTRVAIQAMDAWSSQLILAGGKLLDVPAIIQKKGKRNGCHNNSAALWKKDPASYRLVTGWALSGGCWRRHSWVLDQKGRVIETTLPQELYFGVILNNKLAQWFHDL
jgi:hypothetical protein